MACKDGLGHLCERCGGSEPRPGVKTETGFIHAACRTDEERRALRRKPFGTFKVNGRRNRSSRALHPGALNFNKQGQRYVPEDLENPLEPEPTTGVGPQPWHDDALYFRHEEGLTVRECARMCGVTFTRMQKFLNPESKRREKAKQAAKERRLRHLDPEYAQRSRDYQRRYAQAMKRKTGAEAHV